MLGSFVTNGALFLYERQLAIRPHGALLAVAQSLRQTRVLPP